MSEKIVYDECGGCGHFHLPSFSGDCRDNDNRFSAEDLDLMHGEGGWDYVELEEQMRDHQDHMTALFGEDEAPNYFDP